MAPELPEIDLEQIVELDRKQAYWHIYQYAKDDFLHKQDFVMNMATAEALPNKAFKVSYVDNGGLFGELFGILYQVGIEGGDAAREALISGLEELTA